MVRVLSRIFSPGNWNVTLVNTVESDGPCAIGNGQGTCYLVEADSAYAADPRYFRNLVVEAIVDQQNQAKLSLSGSVPAAAFDSEIRTVFSWLGNCAPDTLPAECGKTSTQA